MWKTYKSAKKIQKDHVKEEEDQMKKAMEESKN